MKIFIQQFRKTVLISIITGIAFIANAQDTAPAKIDLTGTWKVNIIKSVLGTYPETLVTKEMRITQPGDIIVINKDAFTAQNIDTVVNDTVLVKQVRRYTYVISGTHYDRKVTDKYTDDGTGIIRIENLKIGLSTPMDAVTTSKYSVSADRKTLTVELVTVYDKRNDKSKFVYERQ